MKIGEFLNPKKKGSNKDKARDMIAGIVGENRTPFGTIMTLPNFTWAIEERIMEYSLRYDFEAIEFDPAIYRKMVNVGIKNRYEFTPYRGTLLSQIEKAKKNSKCHVIADYCGQVHSFTDDIKRVIEKQILLKNGSMFLTFCTRLTGDFKENEFWKYTKRIKRKDLNLTEKMVYGLVNEYKGYTVKTLLRYSDKKKGQKKGAPMILIEVRRVK